MATTRDQMAESNQSALKALNQSLSRLEEMLIGATFTLRSRLEFELTEVQTEITRLQTIEAHLRAADTVVQPVSDVVLAELNRLTKKLDDAIVASAITTANLEFLIDVLDSARGIGDI